jgi:hypothetical protein
MEVETLQFLSVDLAPKATGWASFIGKHIRSWGTITVDHLDPNYEWTWYLLNDFQERLPWHEVEHLVVEFPARWLRASKRTSTHTLETIYFACNCVILAGHSQRNLIVHKVDPNEWQRGLLQNYPGTRKEAARAWVANEYPNHLTDWTEHEIDAIAQGAWWWQTRKWNEAN